MKLKRTLAFLLVLAMSVALIGCGSTAKKVDYQFVLDACTSWIKDTEDLTALGTFMGGNFIGDDLTALMNMMVEEGFVDVNDLSDGLDSELNVDVGTEVKFSVQDEKALDDDAVADYEKDLDNAAESIRGVAGQLSDLKDLLDSSLSGLNEEEMAEVEAQFEQENGMSLEDYKALLTKMCDSFNALAEKLDGAAIDSGVTASVTYKTDDGDAVEEIDFLKIGDSWTSSYMIDMLKEMSSIA